MVGRITSGKSLYGVLAYNRLKIENDRAKVIFSNRMVLPGGDLARLTDALIHKVMQRYLDCKKNCRFVETIFHASLNPHPDDRLSEQQLADIAEEYMQQMGYGEQPYVVYLHRDIARSHIHIVSVRVGPDGVKIDDSNERRRSKAITQALEKAYNLHPATPKQEREGTVPLRKVEYRDSNLKAQIGSVVRNVMDRYRFCTLKEYNALLGLFNVGAEEVRGDVEGRSYAGILYSALDETGTRVGVPIKASRIGRGVGVESLEKHYGASAAWFKKDPNELDRLRETIRTAMHSSRTLPDFASRLSTAGVQVIVWQNPEGRIYGVTFVDHHAGFIINGSKLSRSKEFAANRFNELFGAHTAEELTEIAEKASSREPTFDPPGLSVLKNTSESKLLEDTLAAFDIFATALEQSQYPDPYEDDFSPEKRKKKKRRL